MPRRGASSNPPGNLAGWHRRRPAPTPSAARARGVFRQDQVGEVGLAVVAPVHDGVGGRQGGGTIAARPAAALVAHVERPTGGGRDHPLRAAHVGERP